MGKAGVGCMNPASSHRQVNRISGIEEIVLAARRDARDVAPPTPTGSDETIGTWVVRQAWLMTAAQIGRGMANDVGGPAGLGPSLDNSRKGRA
jgi:hypothetical protein